MVEGILERVARESLSNKMTFQQKKWNNKKPSYISNYLMLLDDIKTQLYQINKKPSSGTFAQWNQINLQHFPLTAKFYYF